jgi:hypothetical protein
MARVVDIRAGTIACDDTRRLVCARVIVLGGYVIAESELFDLGREIHGFRSEIEIQLKYFSAVDRFWVFGWTERTQRKVTRGPIPRYLTSVDFILQRHLDSITGKCYRAKCPTIGFNTGNTADEEIRFGEIENRREIKCSA